MKLDDDNLEDLASSTSPELDDTGADEAAAAAVAAASDDAGSSSATGEKEGDDLLSVVRDVVNDRQPAADAASPAAGEENSEQQGAGEGQDEYSDVPFNKHPRFQALVREKNSYKQDAERYNNVQTFIDNQGLSAEEAADGLIIMGLIKTDPVEAWKRVKPTIQKLLMAAGEALPDDLKAHVDKGTMSYEAALEVSRSRAGVNSVHATRTFEQQRNAQREQQQARDAIAGAADAWEADRRKKDPNFDAKIKPLKERIYILQREEGVPDTPQGVKAQLDKAYKMVVPPAPKAPQPKTPQPKTPIPGGQVAGAPKPPGTSTLDIIRARRRSA